MSIKSKAVGSQWGFSFEMGDINDRIRPVLGTSRNGWTFNQDLGSEIRRYIRHPNNTEFTEAVIAAIHDALDRAGIKLQDLEITPTRTGGRLMIRLVHSGGEFTMEA